LSAQRTGAHPRRRVIYGVGRGFEHEAIRREQMIEALRDTRRVGPPIQLPSVEIS
jgi:hypothetical protein